MSAPTGEALAPSFKLYARNVMDNAKALAQALRSHGFDLVSVTEPDLCSDDPSRKLMRQVMGAFHEYEKAMIDQANLIVLFQPIYQFAVRDVIQTFPLTAAGWEVELFEASA